MSTAYTYHPLDDSRFGHVQYLFREVFGKRVSLDYLRAKYDTSWTGRRHLCYLAYHDGAPVAFYGALPQEFIHQGQTFLAAHTCDSYTMPAHQRKGLHKALALRTYDLMREQGIRFVYAYHSENTYHSCKKLNWKEGKTMRGFWVPTGTAPWGKAWRRLPLLKGAHHARVRKVLTALQSADAAERWATDRPHDDRMRVHYRPEFFAYKTFTPNAIVEIAGARFWIKAEAFISVGAVQFEAPEQLHAGIAELRQLGRRLGLSQILFQTAPDSALNACLEQHHAGFDTWLVGYLDFEAGIPFSDWEMRFGDLDTF